MNRKRAPHEIANLSVTPAARVFGGIGKERLQRNEDTFGSGH